MLTKWLTQKGDLNMEYPKIRGKRSELHLSQEDMARELGISVKTYNVKENGKSEFTLEEARKLLKIFNCKFEEIFLP